MKRLAIATVWICAASAALAASDGRKGAEGLARLDYSIANTGAGALSCDVKLAHWFSDHLATIAPGATGGFALWSDAQSGAVYLLNAAGDRMPVERLWCGPEAESWAGRHEIALPRLKGAAARGESLACAARADATDCAAR